MVGSRNCTSKLSIDGVGGGAATLAVRQVRHWRPWSWGWSPLWPRRCRERNPDASLSAGVVRAMHFAEPHAAVRRGSSTGSAGPRGTATRAGGSVRNLRRNTDCRGHSRNRCGPVPRSARNCRVDTIAGLPACSPRTALDKAARVWHKGEAIAPPCACAKEGPGFLPRSCPGLRLSGVCKENTARAPSDTNRSNKKQG